MTLSYARKGVSAPLIIDLHGAGANAQMQKSWSHLVECAEQQGWHIHWPEGHGRTWNAGEGMYFPAAPQVDHVSTLTALAERLRAELNASHVFVSGLSNGCAMAMRLGLESEAFDAVSCTSHASHPDIKGTSAPPLLLLTADDDHTFASAAAVDATLAAYARAGGCGVKLEAHDSQESDVSLRRLVDRNCTVEHALYAGGGHMTADPLRSSERMCDFFERFV